MHPPKLLALIGAVAFVASAVPAQEAEATPGLRLGVTDDPDAFFLGFSYAIPLTTTRSSIFVLEPGVDLGVGDDAIDFFIRGTAHFKFLFPIGRSREVVIYPLVGPEIIHIEFDAPFEDADDTEVGVDLGFGFGFRQFSFELWVGLSDVPDITAAFAFHF